MYASQPSHASGSRQRTNTAGLITRFIHCVAFIFVRSKIFLQVHTRVERGRLARIAVEHQGVAYKEVTDAPLLGLAPARVIHLEIEVGVKAVFVRRRPRPGI